MLCLATANIDVADGTIFRFTKLPIELRYKVYEFAVIGEKPLVHGVYNKRATTLGLGILATCHAIYQECLPFFWRNTFVVNDLPKSFQFMKEYFMRNVRKASFEWFGYRMKDPLTIQMLHKCKKLESLHVVLTGHCGSGGLYDRPQYLFQDDTSIRNFSRTNGFDSLVSLHGLKQATVSRTATTSTFYHTASKAEFDIFEVFLIKKLTEPVKAPSKKRKVNPRVSYQDRSCIYIANPQNRLNLLLGCLLHLVPGDRRDYLHPSGSTMGHLQMMALVKIPITWMRTESDKPTEVIKLIYLLPSYLLSRHALVGYADG
jgi:hypothetical protein